MKEINYSKGLYVPDGCPKEIFEKNRKFLLKKK